MRAVLEVVEGTRAGEKFEFDRHDTFLVGRSSKAKLRITDDPYVSTNHFLVEMCPPRVLLRDLGSSNGTYVNGKKVDAVELRHKDEIAIGRTRLRVNVADAAPQAPRIQPILSDLDRLKRDFPPPPGITVEAVLGVGGMGVVYRGVRQANGEPVAVKVMQATANEDAEGAQLFMREVSVLCRLSHRRIVRFHDVGFHRDRFYLTMEYIPAIDLQEMLTGSSNERRIRIYAGIICQVLEALQYTHDLKLVHRDIKPSNILVMQEGRKLRTKLADFGLAKCYADAGGSGMTDEGTIRGTIPYMSPEQISDCRGVRPPADVYSVAATLYHWISGTLPHEYAGKQPILVVLQDDPVPLLKRCPWAPKELVELIHRAMARDPADRFRSADEMRRALMPFAKGD